jgi:hypothetical protein
MLVSKLKSLCTVSLISLSQNLLKKDFDAKDKAHFSFIESPVVTLPIITSEGWAIHGYLE